MTVPSFRTRFVGPTALAFVTVLLSPAIARADLFAFKTLEGFEKCLQMDHLVESTKTETGDQTRLLGQVELQMRCIERAVAVLEPLKSKATDLDFIGSVKRLSAPENSVALVAVLVGHALSGCNELAAYEVLTKTLSHPKNTNPSSNYAKAKNVVKQCLKDKEFRADFLEEKDRPDAYLSKNACEVLMEENVVKSCGKGR